MPKATQQELTDLESYRSFNAAPTIEVMDTDSIEVCGFHLYVHEDGLASRIKGVIRLTPHQWQNLLWDYLELDEVKNLDLSSVNLSGYLERR